MLLVTAQCVGCVLVADFLSGFVHWLEDAYGDEDLPVLGELVTRRNNLHHRDPGYSARFSYWHTSWLLIAICAIIGIVASLLSAMTWQLGLVLLLGANANQIHKWTHRSRRRNGRLVTWMMDARLIASQRHHAGHHTGTENTCYCVLTPHLNPLLDRIRLWSGLEWLIERGLGLRRRDPRFGSGPAGHQHSTRPPYAECPRDSRCPRCDDHPRAPLGRTSTDSARGPGAPSGGRHAGNHEPAAHDLGRHASPRAGAARLPALLHGHRRGSRPRRLPRR